MKNSIDKRIECDQEKLFQVIRNLLSNAIKFSRSDGVIEVQFNDCELETNSGVVAAIEMRLTDEGEGIEADDLERIFDMFTQSKNSQPGGAGLGLSISHEIILLHQGEIWAENSKDSGAMLVIRLPRVRPPDKEQS